MRRLAVALLAAPVIASIYVATLFAALRRRPAASAIAFVVLVGTIGGFLWLLPSPGASPAPAVVASPAPLPLAGAADGAAPSATPEGAAPSATPEGAAPSGTLPAAAPPSFENLVVSSTRSRATQPPVVSSVTLTAASGSIRVPASVQITGSQLAGNRLQLGTSIVLQFSRPVGLDAVRSAFTITPPVQGTMRRVSDTVYTFTPDSMLAANTAYTLGITKAITDGEGRPVAAPRAVHLLTVTAPSIAAFRPALGTTGVDPTAAVSVTFTKAMNRASTASAFSVVIAGRVIPGSVSWAHGDTVLVFTPRAPLPAGAGVGVRLLGTATSADGAPIARGSSATFSVLRAPAPKPATVKPRPVATPSARSGGTTAPTQSTAAAPVPASGVVEGVDVSHHNGSIAWGQVAASGKRFVYMKATEGTTYVDPRYAANRAGAHASGLLVGAFHYAQPHASLSEAIAEADHFVAVAGFGTGDLVPMLDLEVTNGLSSAQLEAWTRTFLDRVYARTGVRPGVYVSPTFWRNDLADTSAIAGAGYQVLWLAHWTSASSPSTPGSDWGGHGWTIWQYTNHGSVPGIGTNVDLDRVTGSAYSRLIIR